MAGPVSYAFCFEKASVLAPQCERIAHHSTHGDDLMVASSFVILLRPCVKLHYQIAPVHKTEKLFFRMVCYKFSGLAMNDRTS